MLFRSQTSVGRVLERRGASLAAVAARLAPNALRADIRHARTRLDPSVQRLGPAVARALEQRTQQLESAAKLLESFSYKNVLARGFALVTDGDGNLVREPKQVRPGETLGLEFANEQRVAVTVSGAPATPRKRSRPPSDGGGQESLF